MRRSSLSAFARTGGAFLPASLRHRVGDAIARRAYTAGIAASRVSPEHRAWAAAERRPVSIVIPSYNDVPLLRAALASIAATCSDFTHEVIVVDDYCQPENSELLRELESATVRVIFKDERQGFAVTVNRGMSEAKHDIVLLNSDIVAQPGWLEALQHAAYAIDPAIGMVSPMLVYPSGRVQYGGTYYARVLAPQWFGHLFVGRSPFDPLANVAGYNRSVSGACVYVRAEVYREVGPLDEQYWLGFEDVDWGLSAWAHGFRCYYEPAAKLTHHESASRGYSQGWRELGSMRYFWRRWGERFIGRRLPHDAPIDFVVSSACDPLWRSYVEATAERMRELGAEVTVREANPASAHPASAHAISPHPVDESLVAELAVRESLTVCCDWGAATTVWLATLEHGIPVYLLPGVESGEFPGDPGRQAAIVAGYRPEFDYVAPNRWTADQLRAEAAWEVQHRVVPALPPRQTVRATDAGQSPPVVVGVGLDPIQSREVHAAAARHGWRAVTFATTHPTPHDLDEIAELAPSVVVSFCEWPNALQALAFMGLGAAFIGRPNERTRYEVLDGYNALLVEPGDALRIAAALDDALGNDAVRGELAANGAADAARHAEAAPVELLAALRKSARTPV